MVDAVPDTALDGAWDDAAAHVDAVAPSVPNA